eukprot:evm.model.scf_1746.1 EVM.evm.TU.scf_1746.1   scf_1746:6517-12957(+)
MSPLTWVRILSEPLHQAIAALVIVLIFKPVVEAVWDTLLLPLIVAIGEPMVVALSLIFRLVLGAVWHALLPIVAIGEPVVVAVSSGLQKVGGYLLHIFQKCAEAWHTCIQAQPGDRQPNGRDQGLPKVFNQAFSLVAILGMMLCVEHTTEATPIPDTVVDMPNIPAFPGFRNSEAGSPGRTPYMAQIRRPGSRDHVCSGILVAQSMVVTAAHCVDPGSAYSAGARPLVHIGAMESSELDDFEVQVVEHTSIHPRKWDGTQRSPINIALLNLPSKRPVPRIFSDHFRLSTGQKLTAAGWGPGSGGPVLGEAIFGQLRVEHQTFIDGMHCSRSILWDGRVEELTFLDSACKDDSAARLLHLGPPTFDFDIGLNLGKAREDCLDGCSGPLLHAVEYESHAHAHKLGMRRRAPKGRTKSPLWEGECQHMDGLREVHHLTTEHLPGMAHVL